MNFQDLKMAVLVLVSLARLLTSCEVQAERNSQASAKNQSAGRAAESQQQFQGEFDKAYRTISSPHKGVVMSPSIKAGDEFMMKCTPKTVGEKDKFSISFGDVAIGQKNSLVFIDESDRLFLVSSSSPQEYIGDNTIQANDIERGASVSTDASTTYGHMDSTGYPYAAFGASGRHLIVLVDDALVFDKHRLRGSRSSEPKVLAACVVRWAGLH